MNYCLRRILAIALSAAVLILLFVACGGAGGTPGATQKGASDNNKQDTHNKRTELSQTAVDLIGTWMVVGGEGTDYIGNGYYSQWMDYDEMTFYIWQDGGGALCVKDDYTRFEDHAVVTRLDQGSFASETMANAWEEYGFHLNYEFRLEDAPECHQMIWEDKFAAWSDITDSTREHVNRWYQENKKDRLILHITGYKQNGSDPTNQTLIDTTLTLEKILPLFFDRDDVYNLYGSWVDANGNKWRFNDSDDEDDIVMTSAGGFVYSDGTFYGFNHEVNNSNDLLLRLHIYLQPKDESCDQISYIIKGATYDGKQVVLRTETGDTIVLTPAA